MNRFPPDFMFQLSNEEKEWIIQNHEHFRNLKFSPGLPYAFTEHGSVMLSSVLNSEMAIEVNIQVIRVFKKIRRSILDNTELRLELEKIKRKLTSPSLKSHFFVLPQN
ncbi:MAG: ORF6N domain-containing protein [Bacteroidota bacterium]|nr:ORF6N domain-containing protein [Bacteroidota bacterium]